MSERTRRLELFCPAEFHGFSGVDICLLICRKRVCSVFKNLLVSSEEKIDLLEG